MLTQDKIINQIIEKINKGNLLIFAGAGISIPSKLPSGKELVDYIIKYLNKNAKSLIKIDDEKIETIGSFRPEVLFDIIQDSLLEDLQLDKLLSGFNNAEPNQIHYFIAQLLVDKKIGGVITTNYDLLIERAFYTIKNLKKSTTSLKIIANEDDFSTIGKEPFIFKVHGTLKDNDPISSDQNRLNPFYAVSHFANIPIKFKKQFKQFLEKNDILILGYSGNDDFSLKPIFLSVKNFNPKNCLPQLFWVEHYNNRYQYLEEFDKRSSELIIRERDSEISESINNYRDEKFLIQKFSILIESDTSNFINLLIEKLNYLRIIPSQNKNFNPFSGIEEWFSTILSQELASLCLIKMLEKHYEPIELKNIIEKVAPGTVNSFEMPIKAQWKFEQGIIYKEAGDPLTARVYFAAALKDLTSFYEGYKKIPVRITKLAHQINYMYGFTYNDEKNYSKAIEKFKEKTIFGENLKGLCEVCWPMKDSGDLKGARKWLENLLESKKKILNRMHNKQILAEIYDIFSWILTDLVKGVNNYENRKKVWEEIVKYNDKAREIIRTQFNLQLYGSYLRSGAIQKLQMIEQHLELRKELTSIIFKGKDFIEEANNNIKEAITIFKNIDRNQDIIFTLTAKIRLLYIEKNFITGDKIFKELQNDNKFNKYMTHWAKTEWLPNELKNLKKLRTKIEKYYKELQ